MSTPLNNKAPTGIEALSETKNTSQTLLPNTFAENPEEVKAVSELRSLFEIGESVIDVLDQLVALFSVIEPDDSQAQVLARLGKNVADDVRHRLSCKCEQVEGFLTEIADYSLH